jgi:hypothetical protein
MFDKTLQQRTEKIIKILHNDSRNNERPYIC